MTSRKPMFINFAIFITLLVVATAGFFTFSASKASSKTTQTTLFDGSVTYCYSSVINTAVQQGHTGVLGVDLAQKPSLIDMNEHLKLYGLVFHPVVKGDTALVLSGTPKWHRLCKVKLPDSAIAYDESKLVNIEPDYDLSQDLPKPDEPNALKHYYTYHQLWFSGDRLVHVEVVARPIP